MPTDILGQPWQIQAALAFGYLAYVASYTGIRVHHGTVHIAFITIVFSFLATLTFFFLGARSVAWQLLGAFVACGSAAVVWRACGRDLFSGFMHGTDLSWSNDDPSALFTLTGRTRHKITQVAVLLDDGTWLRCDDVNKFKDAAYWPCLIGPAGDVALYLTHEESPGSPAKEMKTVVNDHYGDRLTYVPANRVKRLTVRFTRN
jgi:hypothetical protein